MSAHYFVTILILLESSSHTADMTPSTFLCTEVGMAAVHEKPFCAWIQLVCLTAAVGC